MFYYVVIKKKIIYKFLLRRWQFWYSVIDCCQGCSRVERRATLCCHSSRWVFIHIYSDVLFCYAWLIFLNRRSVRNYMTKFLSDQWMMDRDLLAVSDDVSESHWYSFYLLFANILFYILRMKGFLPINFLLQVVEFKGVRVKSTSAAFHRSFCYSPRSHWYNEERRFRSVASHGWCWVNFSNKAITTRL